MTWGAADTFCSSNGMQLCSFTGLNNQLLGCATGCSQDGFQVWSRTLAVSISVSLDEATHLLSVTVSDRHAPPNATDWVGVYPAATAGAWDDMHPGVGSSKWGYVPTDATATRTLDLSTLAPGEYAALLLQDNSYVQQHVTTFEIHPRPPSQPPFPPEQAPMPPPVPPPRLAAVGDDPLFVGGDGVPYEVQGTAGAVFNLVSAAELSINARFVGVPEAFKAEDITETVLGDVGIALCDGRSALRTLTFTADGRLELDGGVVLGARGDAEGFMLELTRLVCDLSEMACGWRVHDGAPLRLPLFDGGHSRIKLRTARANLTITRNAMVDLGLGTEIDCTDFAPWPTAAVACTATLQGGETHEVVLMLAGPKLRREQRFHFMEVELHRLDMQAGEIHGLLGQRALETATAEGPDLGASASRRAGVGATGAAALMEAARRFGSQGEGAIEGVVGDYRRVALDAHGGERFARFRWCHGGDESS